MTVDATRIECIWERIMLLDGKWRTLILQQEYREKPMDKTHVSIYKTRRQDTSASVGRTAYTRAQITSDT